MAQAEARITAPKAAMRTSLRGSNNASTSGRACVGFEERRFCHGSSLGLEHSHILPSRDQPRFVSKVGDNRNATGQPRGAQHSLH